MDQILLFGVGLPETHNHHLHHQLSQTVGGVMNDSKMGTR